MARRRLQHVSKTGEHSRALESTPEHNELTTRQRISSVLRRKSRAISQLAFWGRAGSTPAASTILRALRALRMAGLPSVARVASVGGLLKVATPRAHPAPALRSAPH